MERLKVIAIAACSMDGLIAQSDDELVNWSSKEDKKLFAEETKKAGVVIMGRNTFKTLRHPLKDRLNIILTSTPKHYQPTIGMVEFKNLPPQQLLSELTERNFQTVFVAGGAQIYTQFLKAQLLDELWLTIEPVIFGKGIAIFNETVYGISCSLFDIRNLNPNTVHLRYKLLYATRKS